MVTVRTLLVDNYDSYTYNLYQLISSVNGGASRKGSGSAELVWSRESTRVQYPCPCLKRASRVRS